VRTKLRPRIAVGYNAMCAPGQGAEAETAIDRVATESCDAHGRTRMDAETLHDEGSLGMQARGPSAPESIAL